MSTVVCPICKNKNSIYDPEYRDTFQCEKCAEILRVVIKSSRVTDVRTRKLDLDVPDGLPEDLEQIIAEAISCYEVGSYAATVVMSGLFLEGLLLEANIQGKRLVEMIEKAHEDKMISNLSFHVATASRMLRNIGAHYSEELTSLSASDARLVLEMVRKLADDIVRSGALKK